MSQLYPPPDEAFFLRRAGAESPKSFLEILRMRELEKEEKDEVEKPYFVPVYPEAPIIDEKVSFFF